MTAFPIAVQSLRYQLFQHGFQYVELPSGKKGPPRSGWQAKSRSRAGDDPKSHWPDDLAYLNTGLLCDSLAVLDLDCEDASLVSWIESLAKSKLGPAPIRFRDNSPKRMLFYSYAGEHSSSLTMTEDSAVRLEFRGQGKYVVIDGDHPTGVPYRWDYPLKELKRDMLTSITPEQLRDFITAVQEKTGWNASRSQAPKPITDAEQTNGKPTPSRTEQSDFDWLLKKSFDELRVLRDGQGRNPYFNNAALQLSEMVAGWGCDGRMVERTLMQAMEDNGSFHDHGAQQVQATFRGAWNKGTSQPRARKPDLPELDISAFLSKYDPRIAQSPHVATVTARRSVVLTGLAGVQETPVEWLWPGYLPAGMLTLLSGNGGTGKSTLAFGFAATVTTGSLWPDGKPSHGVGNVLIWSSEDDIARTIKPRLMAAGADVNRIAVIDGTKDTNGQRVPFDPAADIDTLRDEVRHVGGISLLIIDPIVSAVSGDMHKANDVRRSLQPIVDFATEFNCAVLGITHFAKNTTGKNTSERVIGSQAFAALARMVLVTAKEEDSSLRVFTRAKSNISEDEGGLHYTIEPTTVKSAIGLPIQTTRVVWGAAIHGNAQAILASVEGDGDGRKPLNRVEEAMHFLRTELANGPVPARELIERAKRDFGVNERSLQRARERLGIEATKTGFQGAWVWSYLNLDGLVR